MINRNVRSLSLGDFQQKTDAKKQQPIAKIKPDFTFELPKVLEKKFNATDKSSPITIIKYSDDGQNLAMVSSDNVVQYLSSVQLDRSGAVFNGHTDNIRSIDLSHDCTYLISASDDKTCKLWSLKKPFDLLFDIQSLKIKNSEVISQKSQQI